MDIYVCFMHFYVNTMVQTIFIACLHEKGFNCNCATGLHAHQKSLGLQVVG